MATRFCSVFQHLRVLLALALSVAGAIRARAQSDSLVPFPSPGQPARWKPFVGGFVGFNRLADGLRAGPERLMPAWSEKSRGTVYKIRRAL